MYVTDEGYEAGCNNLSITSNPYQLGSKEYNDWIDGYTEAKSENKVYYYRMLPSGLWGEITEGKYNLLLKNGYVVTTSPTKFIYKTFDEYFK